MNEKKPSYEDYQDTDYWKELAECHAQTLVEAAQDDSIQPHVSKYILHSNPQIRRDAQLRIDRIIGNADPLDKASLKITLHLNPYSYTNKEYKEHFKKTLLKTLSENPEIWQIDKLELESEL